MSEIKDEVPPSIFSLPIAVIIIVSKKNWSVTWPRLTSDYKSLLNPLTYCLIVQYFYYKHLLEGFSVKIMQWRFVKTFKCEDNAMTLMLKLGNALAIAINEKSENRMKTSSCTTRKRIRECTLNWTLGSVYLICYLFIKFAQRIIMNIIGA